MCDSKDLVEKIVMDVTNPLDFSTGVPPRLAVGHKDSPLGNNSAPFARGQGR